jgi:hypothetical protein
MYAGLDDEEREALVEVTRMGFPPRSWFGYRTMGMHAFPVLYQGLRLADPTYFEDFWTQPGYLGHDAPPSLLRDRVQHQCTVAATMTATEAAAAGVAIGYQPGQARGGVDLSWRGSEAESKVPVAVRLSTAPGSDIDGADLVISTGASAGARLPVVSVRGGIAVFGPTDADVLMQLQPGDSVEVDNTGFLAAQTYHRHQVPAADFAVWDQFRAADGTSAYPQRPLLLGPLFAAAAAGTVQTGRFGGKMIVVASLLDREALPWQADWYRRKVREHLGDATSDSFRLWYVDNALHGDDEIQEHPTHTISYLGVLHQALRDLSRWVEDDVAPPLTTTYDVVDGQVLVAATAAERGGVQPVVAVTVNASSKADVAAGEQITVHVTAATPPGGGELVAVEWDLDGSGEFAIRERVAGASVEVERQHTFDFPGTHFIAVRVVAQRDGDRATSYARLQNLARVRVVVA